MTLPDVIDHLLRLENRVTTLEHRTGAGTIIVHDKEHDRVLSEMDTIRHTYASHQAWSAKDRQRFGVLRERRNELRKVLGIKA